MASPAIDCSYLTPHRDREEPIFVLYRDGDEGWRDWLGAVVDRIDRLSELPDDWDSYGGLPLSDEAVGATLDLLSYFGPEYLAPEVYPSPDGGLLLQWETPSSAIEIEVGPSRRFDLLIIPKGEEPLELERLPISRLLLDYYDDLKRALRQHP